MGVELEGRELEGFNPKAQISKAVAPIERKFNEVSRNLSRSFDKTFSAENISKTAKTMQDIGDGMALTGYATTASVVGAEVGIPMAALGNTISTVGSMVEFGVQLSEKDVISASQNVGFIIAGEAIDAILNRIIPGPKVDTKKAEQEVLDTAKEIYKQSANLKLIGIERATEAFQENEKRKNNEK